MNKKTAWMLSALAAVVLAGCATGPSVSELNDLARQVAKASFRDEGIVKADKVLNKLGVQDPLLDIAQRLEEAALKDPYFVDRKLYPNVDFYSGIILRAIGIPVDMFPVMFAIGRMPGWIANWREVASNPKMKIHRPRQVYMGPTERDYVPIEKRGE